ncbi:MAG: amidohydrolase family protein, partial [bacterium]|nr:amidohydrolase family protein [bacterium]
IVEVGPDVHPGDRVLDAKGRVVTPGFIDNHFHAYGISLNMLQMEATRKSYVALVGSRRLHAALVRGFTTVRDVAGGDIGLSRAIKEGVIAAPNYYFTGPALSQTGGHGDPRDPHLDLCCATNHGVEVVDGVDALRVAVRERLRTGAHAIKIMASGGVVSLTDPIRVPQYSAEEIRVVTEEAVRRGSYVAAHAYSPEAIVHAVTNGVRSIEHGNLLDEETARTMAAHGSVLVPTLMTYLAMSERGRELGMSDIALDKNTQVLASGKKAIELATSAGVLVGFGTDLMGDLESEQLRGLEVQHEVQGTLELLRSVTSRNAEILGVGTVGAIRSGFSGDLVILDRDPFDHPESLWQKSPERLVVKAGAVVE